MKKNNTMRIAAGLAVAALLSTCLVSGTYAKYTTGTTSKDAARVAKWGVVVEAGGGAFSNKYTKNDETFTKGDGNTVVAQGSYNVVAPGTKGEFMAAKVSGTPEVAVRVANSAEVSLKGWTIDTETVDADHVTDSSAFYCPLTFKVNGKEVDTSSCKSAADAEDAIEKAVAATSDDYVAGTNLSADKSAKIEWAWAFDGNDSFDTKLGNAAAHAATDEAAPTINISVTTTVTQID